MFRGHVCPQIEEQIFAIFYSLEFLDVQSFCKCDHQVFKKPIKLYINQNSEVCIVVSGQVGKMSAELPSLNPCAVPFLSRANSCWYCNINKWQQNKIHLLSSKGMTGVSLSGAKAKMTALNFSSTFVFILLLRHLDNPRDLTTCVQQRKISR